MAGVDGFRGRWVVCLLDEHDVRLAVHDEVDDVLAATADHGAVGVDVPMGLADDGLRACEPEARRRLGSASSSIFTTPPRAVLEHVGSWEGVLAASRAAAGGRGLSKQSFHILPGIKAFDVLAFDRDRVVETHPELSFRAMAPDVPFVSKKTARGQGQRIAAVSRWCDMTTALSEVPDGPAMDDVLDSVACAWSARRWRDGAAEVLGGQVDSTDKPMRIVV